MSGGEPIRFELDGRELFAAAGESILAAARRAGVAIPTCATATACARRATAAPAWWKSTASACLRHRAAAARRRT